MTEPKPTPGTGATVVIGWSWQIWLRFILSVIAPLAVALIAIRVFRLTNDPFDIGLISAAGDGAAWLLDPQAEGYREQLARERRARLLWETTVVCLIVASVAAVAVSLWTIVASLAGKTRNIVLPLLAGMVAVMVVFIWHNDVSLEYTRKVILEPTVGKVLSRSSSCSQPSGCFTIDRFELSRKFTNSISTAATVAIVFAILAATQLSPALPADASFERRARHIAGQAHRLRILLYAAAVVLITVVLSMAAWLLWPVALAATNEIKTPLLSIAQGVGLFWGTSFTLILAAAYLPSAIWLNGCIRGLRANPQDQHTPSPPEETRNATLARFGLRQSVYSQVTQLVAILSPMISGALPFLDVLLDIPT